MERGTRERSAGGRGLLRLGALLLLLLLPGPGVRTRRSGWEGGRDPGRREGHRGKLAVSPGLPGKGRGEEKSDSRLRHREHNRGRAKKGRS